MAGLLQTMRNERPETDDNGAYVRPYRLEIAATRSDHATYQLTPFEVAVHCEGTRFVADRLELKPEISESP